MHHPDMCLTNRPAGIQRGKSCQAAGVDHQSRLGKNRISPLVLQPPNRTYRSQHQSWAVRKRVNSIQLGHCTQWSPGA
eukprot:2235980-Rhodomonas_salina.3